MRGLQRNPARRSLNENNEAECSDRARPNIIFNTRPFVARTCPASVHFPLGRMRCAWNIPRISVDETVRRVGPERVSGPVNIFHISVTWNVLDTRSHVALSSTCCSSPAKGFDIKRVLKKGAKILFFKYYYYSFMNGEVRDRPIFISQACAYKLNP